MKTKTRFAWKQFLKNLAIIAIPVALQNMLTTTGSMIDTIMIAPLGETTVGAVGLCAQFSSLMFAGYWGFFGGGMLFFSQYWGAQDDDGIDHSYGLTLTCMMIVGLTFGAFAIFAPETVMKLYTDKESIQVIGAEYLRIIGFGYPVQVFSMAMSALLRSTERVRIPLFASIASVASNIFLNWVFIYGKFGLPEMGVRGAALATSLAAVINVLVILILARAQKYPYLFHFKKHFRWNKKQVKSTSSSASPSSATKCSSAWATWLSTLFWADSPNRPLRPSRCSARWRAWSSASLPVSQMRLPFWSAHAWAPASWTQPTSAQNALCSCAAARFCAYVWCCSVSTSRCFPR